MVPAIIWLLIKVTKLEEKTVNISSSDITAHVEQLRNMLIESERVANVLDAGITEKEYLLEDLTDLLEARIDKINRSISYDTTDKYKDDVNREQLKELLANTKTSAILEEMSGEITDTSHFSSSHSYTPSADTDDSYGVDIDKNDVPSHYYGDTGGDASIHDEIYYLLMQGYTEEEIADELNITLEEIVQTMSMYS